MRRAFATALLLAVTASSTDAAPRRARPADTQLCASSTNGTFLGTTFNYVGGADTGDLAGINNGACDDRDAILGGFEGAIAGNGHATDSFIGGGTSNLINDAYSTAAASSFIGAGQANTVGAGDSGLVAGFAGAVQAGQAFVGAGQYDAAGGGYSAIIAGYQASTTGYDSFVGSGYRDGVNGNGAFAGGGGYQYYQGVAKAPNTASGQDAFVGSGDENAASGLQAFAGAGVDGTASGADAFTGAGDGNASTGAYAFGGAGVDNTANGYDAFTGAGYKNAAGAECSFVGAGGALTFSGQVKTPNAIGSAGIDAFIGGGDGNAAAAETGFIGAGASNALAVANTSLHRGAATGSAIVGGYGNSVAGPIGSSALYGFAGGGFGDALSASYAVALGGRSNDAGGIYAAVPGGENDVATGASSFAAGTGSVAANPGAFVWSDAASGAAALESTASNQFLARASGGVAFYSNAGLTSGVRLAAGSGAWASLSDRTMKTSIVPLDAAAVLRTVARLPVSAWSYRSEDPRVRHLGPMAQDFYAGFRLGTDDRHIATVDEAGVALAAIQGLHAAAARRRDETSALAADLSHLQRDEDARLRALERKAAMLAKRLRHAPGI